MGSPTGHSVIPCGYDCRIAFKRQDLTRWLERARGGSLAGHTVRASWLWGLMPWVLEPRWIELKNARKAAGWVVLCVVPT